MTNNNGPRPLDGIKVFELGIAIAAPWAGRELAYHGAEVFKIESPTSPDFLRMMASGWLREHEEWAAALPDSGPYLAEFNANKKSVALDLKQPEAIEAAQALLAECDVFLGNFGARALVELGFGYDSVKKIRPDIVYVALPGFGSEPTAPYYRYVAWGPNQAPLVGMDDLTGHAGREPAGVTTIAPPDYISAQHAAFSILLGLEHRDRTGEGSCIDVAQFETSISQLGPFLMDYSLSGFAQSRIGNRSLWDGPSGVYPCLGEERWIAISVESEEQWQAFTNVAPESITGNEQFSSSEGRLQHAGELDAAVAEWTAGLQASQLATELQAAGVAAHIVATNEDILQDPHVMEGNSFFALPSARWTRDLITGSAIRLSNTPGMWAHSAPSSGQHTVEVLTEVAGLKTEKVEAMVKSGAAFEMTQPDLRIDRPYEDWLHILFPYDAVDGRDS